jgi:hypothetical protein
MSASDEVANKSSALDSVVKYAAVLTWFVYAAGLTRISEFLRTINVPMDLDFFAVQRVVSYGGPAIFDIVVGAAISLAAFEVVSEKPNHLTSCVLWSVPSLYIVVLRRFPWSPSGSLALRLRCTGAVLGAIYLLVLVARKKNIVSSTATQILFALLFLIALIGYSRCCGELDAYTAMASAPHVQLLLPNELVPGSSKLGLSFSTPSAPNLCDPVNVIAFTDKAYYVWLPMERLEAESRQGAVKLQWGTPRTIALPKDKVLIAAGLERPNK